MKIQNCGATERKLLIVRDCLTALYFGKCHFHKQILYSMIYIIIYISYSMILYGTHGFKVCMYLTCDRRGWMMQHYHDRKTGIKHQTFSGDHVFFTIIRRVLYIQTCSFTSALNGARISSILGSAMISRGKFNFTARFFFLDPQELQQ